MQLQSSHFNYGVNIVRRSFLVTFNDKTHFIKRFGYGYTVSLFMICGLNGQLLGDCRVGKMWVIFENNKLTVSYWKNT